MSERWQNDRWFDWFTNEVRYNMPDATRPRRTQLEHIEGRIADAQEAKAMGWSYNFLVPQGDIDLVIQPRLEGLIHVARTLRRNPGA